MREPTAEMRQMTAPTVRASRMAAVGDVLHRRIGTEWLRTYVIALGIGALLGVTGASGTGPLPLIRRLAFWLIVMLAGTLVAQVTNAWLDRKLRLRLWQEIIVMTLVIPPPITVIVWLVAALINSDTPNLKVLPFYLPPVLLVSLCMSVLHATVNRVPLQSHVRPVVQAEAPAEVATAPGEALRARLDFKYRQAAIFALSAEDHYLRIHTSAGETLILMRLYDAIRELDGIEGSQVHRSWWVAKDAVADVARGDGKVDLVLKSGLRTPVSRRYQKALKADGWL